MNTSQKLAFALSRSKLTGVEAAIVLALLADPKHETTKSALFGHAGLKENGIPGLGYTPEGINKALHTLRKRGFVNVKGDALGPFAGLATVELAEIGVLASKGKGRKTAKKRPAKHARKAKAGKKAAKAKRTPPRRPKVDSKSERKLDFEAGATPAPVTPAESKA